MTGLSNRDDRSMGLVSLVEAAGGVARGTHLQRFGYSRWDLSHAVARAAITRIRPGVFATPRTPVDLVTAAAHGGALTCLRALRLHGIWTLGDDCEVHVWMGATGRVHHDACTCVHHFSSGATRLGLAPVLDVLVHTFHCAGEEAFFVALESALRIGKLIGSGRAALRRRLPASARWLIDFARNDADSGLESLLRLRLHRLGITVQSQVRIAGVGRVDFVIDGWLILEADGQENHAGSPQRHRDLRRDAVASRLGYETLRFDYALIVHDWEIVLPAITAALARLSARS